MRQAVVGGGSDIIHGMLISHYAANADIASIAGACVAPSAG
jgi:hypothetical protein